MKSLLKPAFYFFHPLWIPCMGSLLYFQFIPRFFPSPLIKAKLWAVFILSLLLPLVFIYLLINLKLTQSIALETKKARRLFILCMALMLTLINNLILGPEMIELFYFFTGLLLSAAVVFFVDFSRFKWSLHLSWTAALLGFSIGISILYQVKLTLLIAFLFAASGWVASNRVVKGNYGLREAGWSFLTGLLPQFILFGISYMNYKM